MLANLPAKSFIFSSLLCFWLVFMYMFLVLRMFMHILKVTNVCKLKLALSTHTQLLTLTTQGVLAAMLKLANFDRGT